MQKWVERAVYLVIALFFGFVTWLAAQEEAGLASGAIAMIGTFFGAGGFIRTFLYDYPRSWFN